MTIQLAQNFSALMLRFQKQSQEEKLVAEKLEALKININDSREKILSAHENFNNVIDEKMIDFYIYKIQAEQSRYAQLLKEYKELSATYISSVL